MEGGPLCTCAKFKRDGLFAVSSFPPSFVELLHGRRTGETGSLPVTRFSIMQTADIFLRNQISANAAQSRIRRILLAACSRLIAELPR